MFVVDLLLCAAGIVTFILHWQDVLFTVFVLAVLYVLAAFLAGPAEKER